MERIREVERGRPFRGTTMRSDTEPGVSVPANRRALSDRTAQLVGGERTGLHRRSGGGEMGELRILGDQAVKVTHPLAALPQEVVEDAA